MLSAAWAVGEPTEVMYQIIEAVEPHMPADKPRYLMGVGTPSNIMEGVARGIDFFDCVMPARNARHGKLFTWNGWINIKNERYKSGSAAHRSRLPVPGVPAPFPVPICGICSWPGRCWPCVWRCCTTSIFITS